MKNLKIWYIQLYLTAIAPLFLTSCVNQIQEEEEEENKEIPLTGSDIPIRISTQILCTQTRVNNNEFENDDAIGLYVLAKGQKINQTRHIDNMRFTCTSSGLVPDKEVYYPEGDGACLFISYYPYQKTGILSEGSSIDVSIKANQSSSSAYNSSDFMTATTKDITPSKKTVKLDHYHKLSQLNINIQISEDDNIEEFQKKAVVSINNIYTQATYDFMEDDFTAFNTPQNIVPNGTWVIDKANRKLTGKKILLFPQQTTNSKITLQINNREFSASLPSDLVLASNICSEITLHYNFKIGISDITLSVGDWEEGSRSDVALEENEKGNSISIASLDFEQTNVYNIANASHTVIAEVCKEYLFNESISKQAIVLYPTDNKTQGTVLQILNSDENIHGGSVSWDTSNHSFTYIAGNKAPITTLYVDPTGHIALEQPEENSQSITSTGYVLTDIRGSETITYPIVKIGTQYWMRENLNTTQYISGGKIPTITSGNPTAAGLHIRNENRFYNKAAVIKGILAPQGWKIPNDKESEQLKKYINNTAATLKAGSKWETSKDITIANNLTGFNAQPIGFFAKEQNKENSVYSYNNQRVAYWVTGDSPTTLAERGILLMFDKNTIEGVSYNDYSGYSIRCIKE